MPNWYIQRKDNNYFLKTVNNTAVRTKYLWVDKIEEATNFRYQITAQRTAHTLTRTNSNKDRPVRLLCQESTGKIFEVAKIEIEE